MGAGHSKEEQARLKDAIQKLSKVELSYIDEIFKELSYHTDEGENLIRKPTWLNRDTFASKFGLPDFLGERLFAAFDRDQNGTIDVEEFLSGMALCLHGRVKDKCRLLFKIFNLDDDEGITREELATVLSSALLSANAVLQSTLTQEEDKSEDTFEKVEDTVKRIVDDAFETCDTSRNGKLEIDEFVKWVHKNPKLVDNIFVIQCPTPSDRSGSFHVISTPDNTPESERIVSQHDIPAVVQTDQNAQGPSSLIDLFRDTDTPVKDIEGKSFFDSIGTSKSDESLPKLQFEGAGVQKLGAIDTDNVESEIYLTPQGSEVALNKLGQEGRATPDQVESLQSGGITLDTKPLGSTEALWHPLKEPEMSESTESIETERLEEPGISSIEDKETHEASIQIISDAFTTENKPNSTITHPSTGVDIGTKVLSDNLMQVTDDKLVPMLSQTARDLFSPGDLQEDVFQAVIGKPTLRQLAEMRDMEEESTTESKPLLPEGRFSAWIPSEETKALLEAARNGNAIDRSCLTYPTVLLETSLGDPVKDLVTKFIGEQEASKRPVPSVNSVTMNDAGLKDLLNAQCWRGAVDFTAKYLSAHGQGLDAEVSEGPLTHTPKLLQIWFVRVALLFKLRMFSSAEAELNPFGNFDKPDLYYEYYPNLFPNRKGSMVPFSLRVIHAELPQHNGKPNESLDRLYNLLNMVRTIIQNLEQGYSEEGAEDVQMTEEERKEAIDLWVKREIRLLYSIGNCFIGMKEISLAVKVFKDLMTKEPESKAALLSGIGRLHLQLGDITLAQKYFRKVDQIALGDPKTLSIIVMNKGFLALAQGQYEEAKDHFMSVTKLDPENSAAFNNAAVCLLFLGKVKEASTLLETLIWQAPPKNLHEDILFNLCTIYELETSRSLQKKQKLLDLVGRHKGDGYNVQSLKLS